MNLDALSKPRHRRFFPESPIERPPSRSPGTGYSPSGTGVLESKAIEDILLVSHIRLTNKCRVCADQCRVKVSSCAQNDGIGQACLGIRLPQILA